MNYLQLFESTRQPWTGDVRTFYILWSEDGTIIDHGAGHPQPGDDTVRIKLVLHVKIRDFERTVESANPQAKAQGFNENSEFARCVTPQ